MKTYLYHLFIAANQLVNAVFGGWPDETMSSRAHRAQDWRRKLINALFFWQNDHCRGAYNYEQTMKHLPPEFRDGN